MPNFAIHQVDAFTDEVFGGNPAAVVPLTPEDEWLTATTMQAIAAENALSETAFIRPRRGAAQQLWDIRWFTPAVEVDLCGHATLASAHVVLTHLRPADEDVVFVGAAVGELAVSRAGDRRYRMSLPRRACEPCQVPPGLFTALGRAPRELLGGISYVAVYETQAEVAALEPTMADLMQLDRDGVIATAPAEHGSGVDFVSRYFVPAAGIPEDPVTGSAHCLLAPLWAGRLGKAELEAAQISARGGRLSCRVLDDTVEVGGTCVDYLVGTIQVPRG